MDPDQTRAQLVGTYAAVRRFAGVVGPPGVEPDDLVQEAFALALRRGLDDIDNLASYLRRTILNLSTSARRTWARRQAMAHQLPALDVTDESYSVDVAELLALTPDVRAVLWLAEIEGWSYAEIGEMVGCGEAAARTRASRARRRLRVELAREVER
jgi:RNA polymerase sigma-70 factor (ECF subfamily)